MPAPLPADEAGRLAALREYSVLDTTPEADFDDITTLAAQICGTPIALISLVDYDRQWFKSRYGIEHRQTPREEAFCAYALVEPSTLVVPDASNDPRFKDLPCVTEESGFRFYAGAPLITPTGHALGTLCVLDRVPRQLAAHQQQALEVLSRHVMAQLELRRHLREKVRSQYELLDMLEAQVQAEQRVIVSEAGLARAQSMAHLGNWEWEIATRRFFWSAEVYRIFGVTLTDRPPTEEEFLALIHPDDRDRLCREGEELIEKALPLDIEHRVIRPDGVVSWVHVRGELIRDKAGQPVRLSGTVLDITERILGEEERDRLFNLSLDLLCVGRFDGRFEQVNPAWTHSLGWSAEELTEGPWLDFLHPDDRDASFEAHQSLQAGKSVRDLENRFRCKDGSYRWLSWNSHPLMESQQIFSVARDVTERKRAQDQLQSSQTLQRIAGKAARLGGWSIRLSDRVLTWSDETCAIHDLPPGYQPTLAEGIGYYPPEAQAEVARIVEACAKDGTPYDFEMPKITATGRRIWVRSIGEAVRDAEGRIVQLQGAFQDITERKAAEEVLRDSEERYSIVVRGSAAGLWDWDIRTDKCFFSPRVHEMLDRTGEELPGTVQAFFQEILHPDDLADITHALQAHLEKVAPYNVEYRLRTRSGEYRWFNATGQALWDENGQAYRMAGSLLDITGRKLDERAIRESEERLRLLAKATNDAIWDWDLETDALWWNEGFQSLFGYAPGEVEPTIHAWRQRLHPSEKQSVIASVRHALAHEKESWVGEHRFRCKDGTYSYVLDRGHLIRNKAGKPIRMIGGMTDLTERKQAEMALAESNRALQWLSRSNEALLRSETETELLDAVCRVAVEVGRYQLAWVGYAREGRPLQCLSNAGVPHNETTGIPWALESDAIGSEAAEKVLRLGEAVVLEGPGLLPESAPAGRAPFHGGIWLPVRNHGETLGVFGLHLNEARHLSPEELKLLRELTDNLGAGISNLRSQNERRRMQSAMMKVAASVSASADETFFEQLAGNMTDALGAYGGFVARFLPGEPLRGRTIAGWVNGAAAEPLEFSIKGTPCERLLSAEVCVIPTRAAEVFPASPALAALGAEAYVGRRLMNSAGQLIGTLFVIYREPLRSTDFVASTLQIFAARVEDELERQQVELRIREQASLLDKAQDAIVVRGLDQRITYWNKRSERLFGWAAGEVLGCSIMEVLHRENDDAFNLAMESVLQDGEWSGELRTVSKAGRPLILEARWTLVQDESGRPKSILSINTDITEKKRLEAQFLRAQRMESIGRLAGGIAHDLNNVLAPVMMSVHLLRLRTLDAEEQEMLTTVDRSCQRGADLVRQVLSFARGVDGQRITVNPLHLMRELLQVMRDTFPKSISLACAPSPDLWTVTGDPTQLHQIFLNLCVNARDAMPEGGKLRVTMENVVLDGTYTTTNPEAKAGAYVIVKVSDTGLGIPAEIRDMVFEPFFTTKEIGKGTGLGLSTTLAIVKSHGGFINLTSEVGRGTQFEVYLPANTTEAAADRAVPDESRTPQGRGELVLVVDDEEAIRKIAQRTLERSGYRVVVACQGAEAVSIYAQALTEISVVLTDMAMPIMDGPALIVALKAMNPDVRIVASSGMMSSETLAKATNAGVMHFVPKPYTADALLNTLREAISTRTEGQISYGAAPALSEKGGDLPRSMGRWS